MSPNSKTYIFRSREQADLYLKQMANLHAGFGVDATTPLSFVASKWEVWGDGRSLISNIQRMVLVNKLLLSHSDIPATVGSVRILSSFIQRISGTPELAHALSCIDEFDACDSSVLRLIQNYADMLHAYNLIEPAEAASIMASCSVPVSVELNSKFALPVAIENFLGADCCATEAMQYNTGKAKTKFRFAMPAGPAAVFSSLTALIDNFESDGCVSILIFAPDALALFEQLIPYAADKRAFVSVDASISLLDTQFGRALSAVCAMQKDDGMAVDHAVDFAYSIWSGLNSLAVSKLDANLRSNRLSSIDDIEAALLNASASYELFAAMLAGKPLNDEIFDALQSIIRVVPGIQQADRAAEIAALKRYREVLEQACSVGASASDVILLLETIHVPLRSAAQPDKQADISLAIRDMSAMSEAASASFDAVVVADASEDAIASSSKDDCLTALEKKLGFSARFSAADEARLAFTTSLKAAKLYFACIVPGRNADGKTAYPSFVVEDLLSQLTNSPVDVSKVHNAIACIDPESIVLGEDNFVESVGKCLRSPHDILEANKPERGKLNTLRLIDFLKTESTASVQMPVFSPSAIEKYIHCPYSWFLDCRIGPKGIDESFGAVETGTFVHEVMAEFYARGKKMGYARAELMDAPDALLDEAFQYVLERQFQESCGNRFAPLTVAEMVEVKQLQSQLHLFVKLLGQLPHAYIPESIEMPIDASEHVTYAGAILNGRIDRVDVDENGNFVILDYKGSIAGHALGNYEKDSDDCYPIPNKTQALMYAQAYKSMHSDKQCAAALYLSYRAQRAADLVAGAYDASLYNVDECSSKSSKVCDMTDVLDNVEKSIQARIEELIAGDISISPDSKNVCEYCSFAGCERAC